ncbi:MAG: hypothetical protein HY547_02025 [Elusimicrobia bacterium]|nr:hypothetical protein [Elusimicrobiota bacterium]
MSEPLILGRIGSAPIDIYFNNMKFFGNYITLPSLASTMADLMLRGKMMAGPVASYDYVKLIREGCQPLADFGLFVNPYMAYDQNSQNDDTSALIHAPAVLLIKKPIEDFGRLKIGIAPEALNGGNGCAVLLKMLLAMYWEIEHQIELNLSENQDAWLCQGGPYLLEGMRQVRSKGRRLDIRPYDIFPCAYDLAWEWYRWKHAPYIFYRWVCHPDLNEESRDDLIGVVRRTLELNLRGLAVVAQREAYSKEVQRGEALTYLQGFGHRLGLWRRGADEAMTLMAGFLRDSDISVIR